MSCTKKLCIQAASVMMAELLEDSSDDDVMVAMMLSGASSAGKVVPKIHGYAEIIVPQLDDLTFKSHFRMLPSTFDILLKRVSSQLSSDSRQNIGPEKQLMICIWTLANQESFRSVAERFGVSKSTAHSCVMRAVEAILIINQEHGIIKWPSTETALQIAMKFESAYGFPGVVGCVDGSHIQIKAPHSNPSSYVNRKGFHSILLQGVCNDQLEFIDCYAGEVGSIHDACMLRRSELFDKLQPSSQHFPPETHLLGDPAYPLMERLLVAFKDNGHLTRREQVFNTRLSTARCCIERAFALLKGRFRRLKYLNMDCLDMMPKVIIACCVLHNVCLSVDDNIDHADLVMDEIITAHRRYASDVSKADRQAGAAKRSKIADLLKK